MQEGTTLPEKAKPLNLNVVEVAENSQCHCPNQAYFGGEARCDAEAGQGDDYDPRELICGACSDVSRAQVRMCLGYLAVTLQILIFNNL